MRRAILFAITLATSVLFAADPPQAEINSKTIKAKLYLPDATNGYYRGTRFDWSGVISSLQYQGHEFFGVWFRRYDPKINDAITGPVEEYRTGLSALGYDEAKPGENFVRIGVGLVKKPAGETTYQQFRNDYEIVDNGKWTIKKLPDAVEFTQEVTDPASGYAYLYKKTVKLAKDSPRLTIEHSLKNTGKKVIETNVYNHGFFMFDSDPSGPDIVVKFPFEPKATSDLRGMAEITGKEFHYLKELDARTQVHSELTGFGDTAKDYDFRIEDSKTHTGVHVTGDKPLWKIDFWSPRTTVCPEAYLNMKIEPGKESVWHINYDFYVLPAAK